MTYKLACGIDTGIHPDDVSAALTTFRCYEYQMDTPGTVDLQTDAMARALLAAQASKDRREREERRLSRQASNWQREQDAQARLAAHLKVQQRRGEGLS